MTYYACVLNGHNVETISEHGASECVPIERFVGHVEQRTGTWLIVDADRLWTRTLPVLQDYGFSLSGSPGMIYSARSARTRAEIRSADSLLAQEPYDARHAMRMLRLARTLYGRETFPRTLSDLLSEYIADFVGDMRECNAPSRAMQRLYKTEYRAPHITIYDQVQSYGAAASFNGLPQGPRLTTTLNTPARGRLDMLDVTVFDKSRNGILPRNGRYQSGEYRTIIASPLLDVTPSIVVKKVHAVYRWAKYDATPLVSYAWGRRCRAQSTEEAAIWRSALHSILGKLGQRNYTYHYQWEIPRGPLTDWSPINLEAGLWARKIHRRPRLRHPWAHAWLRQCALIPLARHHVNAVRVYVDSIATTEILPTGTGLGQWREVARGQIWRANSPGDCLLATQDGEIVWQCGSKKKTRINLDTVPL